MAKILIADDEAELLEMLKFTLESAGHHVIAVPDGRQAMNLAKAQPFNLIILDVMMPHMDGYHAAREIADDPTAPPILLLTSRDYTQDQTAVKGSGASAFLSKPFELKELIDVVRSLTSR